ncbi:MAG: hypothetical protein ACT4NT_00310 [Nitrososphaerota archaeon]
MNGLDMLLYRAILQSIQNGLNAEKLEQIDKRLQQEHGVKFSELGNKPNKIKNQLFEFEDELKKIENKVLRNFLLIESQSSETWLVIMNKHLTELILKTFADEDKKMILDFTRIRSETIPKILSLCNIPNTSGYRKMRQLIDDGFVIPNGMAETFEGRRTLLYKSIIQKIQITIDKGDIFARILVPKEGINSSEIIKAIADTNQGKRILAN